MNFSLIEYFKLDTSLKRLWLFFMILPLAIVYTLLGVLSISGVYFDSEKRMKDYRTTLVEERRDRVKSMVTLIARSIENMPQQQAADMVKKLKHGSDAFWIYDGGALVYHSEANLIGEKDTDPKRSTGGYSVRELAGSAAQKEEASLVSLPHSADDQPAFPRVVYAKALGKSGWVVGGDAVISDIDQIVAQERSRIYRDIMFLVARTVTISLTAVLLIFWIMRPYAERFLTSPVQTFVSTLKDAQSDLTVRIPVKEHNEFGEIATLFNGYTENLLVIMKKVADSAMNLNVHANQISDAVQEQAAVLTEQSTAVTEITSTMEELSASSSQIAEHSKAVVDKSTQTCDDLNSGANAVKAVITKMTEIKSDNEQSIQEIHDLGRKSKEITKIMEIINNIADQTKLIAFNAALEASSAGEAGKRFAVVAVEIRRLADSVMMSTGEIEAKINEIQEAINRLVITSEKGSKGIKGGIEYSANTADLIVEVVDAANQTSSAAKQISLSTQQQKTASSQVLTALKEIMAGSKHSAVSINDITLISKEMALLSDTLKEAIEKFKIQ